MEVVTMLSAIIAAVAAIFASVLSYLSNSKVVMLSNKYLKEREVAQYREKQISKLYFPMHVNLTASNALFKRYFEKSTLDEEKTIIEHSWKRHNDNIFKLLMENSVYLDLDAPAEIMEALPEHIIQWNSVYEMKYTDKTYDGPVFAGIKKFGYRKFPKGRKVYFNQVTSSKGIDGYFHDKIKELRKNVYASLDPARKQRNPDSTFPWQDSVLMCYQTLWERIKKKISNTGSV